MSQYIRHILPIVCLFFFNDPAPTQLYTLSLHDALPISRRERLQGFQRLSEHSGEVRGWNRGRPGLERRGNCYDGRSEEHTSELQSRLHLVCRLLLEKKKKRKES